MSLDTYSNLKAEIADKLGRSDITSSSSIIDTAIDLLEAEANASLRMFNMVTATTLTTVSGTETVSLPSDFIQFSSVYVSTDPSPLDMMTETNIRAKYPRTQTGRPYVYGYYPGNKIVFAPIPDGTYTVNLQYYATIPALSDSNTSNWLLTNYPAYYYYGVLRHLTAYINDPDTRQLVTDEFGAVKNAMDLAEGKRRTAGAGMMSRTTGMTP